MDLDIDMNPEDFVENASLNELIAFAQTLQIEVTDDMDEEDIKEAIFECWEEEEEKNREQGGKKEPPIKPCRIKRRRKKSPDIPSEEFADEDEDDELEEDSEGTDDEPEEGKPEDKSDVISNKVIEKYAKRLNVELTGSRQSQVNKFLEAIFREFKKRVGTENFERWCDKRYDMITLYQDQLRFYRGDYSLRDLHEYYQLHCVGYRSGKCGNCGNLEWCLKNRLNYFGQTPQFIVDCYLKDLSGSATKVLMFLISRADFRKGSKKYGMCWPGYPEIAKATGVSEKNIGKYLKELEAIGLIKHTSGRPGWNKTSHTYTLTWCKKLNELKDIASHRKNSKKI